MPNKQNKTCYGCWNCMRVMDGGYRCDLYSITLWESEIKKAGCEQWKDRRDAENE